MALRNLAVIASSNIVVLNHTHYANLSMQMSNPPSIFTMNATSQKQKIIVMVHKKQATNSHKIVQSRWGECLIVNYF